MKVRFLVSAFLLLIYCTAINTFALEATENPAAQKMAELEWIIGKWKQELTLMPDAREFSQFTNCDWLLGKTIIECKYYTDEATLGELSSLAIFSYNSDLENYTSVAYYGGYGPDKNSLVKNGDSWSWQGELITSGMKRWAQTIYTPKEGVIDLVFYQSTGGEAVEKAGEGKMIKLD